MSIRHKIFVTLAIIASAFYLFEITLTILSQGLIMPVFTKSAIVVILLVYIVIQFRKKNSDAKKDDVIDTVRLE